MSFKLVFVEPGGETFPGILKTKKTMQEKLKEEMDILKRYEHLSHLRFWTNIKDYHLDWVDDCITNAFFNLSRPDGEILPHALTLTMYGGKMSETDFFVLEKRSKWKMACYVFLTNEDLQNWINLVGEDIVIHDVFV